MSKSRAQRKVEERQRAAEERRKSKVADRFFIQFPHRDMLVAAGPLANATWSVPQVLREALEARGEPVPPPIHGCMLVDTGATKTCIAADVAADLRLTPIGLSKTYGAGGLHELTLYQARIQISVVDESSGNQTVVANEVTATAIPELNRAGNGIMQTSGAPVRMIGLFGRDFLKHTKMTYNGPAARVDIQFIIDTMKVGDPINS